MNGFDETGRNRYGRKPDGWKLRLVTGWMDAGSSPGIDIRMRLSLAAAVSVTAKRYVCKRKWRWNNVSLFVERGGRQSGTIDGDCRLSSARMFLMTMRETVCGQASAWRYQ